MVKKSFTRRQFVATVTAGAGTVMFGNMAHSMTSCSTQHPSDPFQMVELGKTGIKTTLLGMGTGFSGYNRSSNITRAGVAEKLIRQAYDKGIRFFDCADNYGTHTHTAAALKGLPRDSYTICTKMWVLPGSLPEPERPDAEVVIDRFRKELNTDYIDLVQMHLMTAPDWPDSQKRFMDGLNNLKAKGIIKAHGVSVHSFEALEVAAAHPWVDVIHTRVNSYGESMDKSDPALIVPVIEKMHKNGKGVIGMKLIGNGKFKNNPEMIDNSLKFVLGLGTVDVIIVGFEQPEQIDDYAGRIRKIS